MIAPDDADEELFLDLLARYSETPAHDPALDPSVPPHLLPRLLGALDGLRRLRRARVRTEDQLTLPHPGPVMPLAPQADATAIDGAGLRPLGRFRLLRPLGGGGGGLVFLAFDPALHREVAVKVPRPASLLSPELRRRFLLEARAAAGLNHPNLVPVHEAGEEGGLCYIVSAYCPGGNLAEWLAGRSEPVSPRLAAELTAAVADALHYVHGRGICHRDVKPSNILLDPAAGAAGELRFTPQLIDFGLAKLFEEEGAVTRSGAVLGTPPYMAPEQVDGRGRDIGPLTDVYGLGAILYELLSGRPPFRGATDADTLRQVQTDDPPPPRRLRPDAPRDLETICLKCLEKQPDRRYATAAALAEDLRRYLAHEPIHARPPGRVERLRKWTRRHPARAALLGGVLFLVLGLLTVELWLEGRRQAQDAAAARIAQATAEREEEVRQAQEQMRQERRRHRDLTYVHDMAQGWHAWENGRLDEVLKAIDSYDPSQHPGEPDEQPGFEWHYLARLARPYRRLIRTDVELVCIAFSPDGGTCASGHSDGCIRLWDPSSGRLRQCLPGHQLPVRSLAYSPDGKCLASGSGPDEGPDFRGELFLWDVSTLQSRPLRRESVGAVNSLTFSSDGLTLAAVLTLTPRGGEVTLWTAATGARRWTRSLDKTIPYCVSFAQDGRSLAAGCSDGQTYLYEAAGGTALGSWEGSDGKPTSSLFAVGGLLASGSHDRAVRLWKGRPGETLAASYTHEDGVWDVTLSADGATIASVSRDGMVKVWDWNRSHPRFSFHLPQARGLGRAIAFAPDGQTLAVGMEDGKLWLCDVPRWPETRSWLAHREGAEPREAWAIVFSPDGQTLASAGDDHSIRLWNPATGKEHRMLKGHESLVTDLSFSPDGKCLASGSYDGTLRLWDVADGRPAASFSLPPHSLRGVAFSPDGSLLASGGKDQTVRLWDVRRGQKLALPASVLAASVSSLAFSPDGHYLAAGDFNGDLSIWRMESRTFHGSFSPAAAPSSSISALAFSADGQTLATVHDGDASVRLSRVGTWEGQVVLGRHKAGARAVAFAPDGQTLAVGYMDGIIRLWHVATQRQLFTFRGNGAKINGLAFAPDGRTLAAALHDGQIKLWRAATEDELRQVQQWEQLP